MKVYILTPEAFPNGMAATGRIKCYARAIHEAGADCEIWIYHRTEVYGKKPKNTVGNGLFEGIGYHYIGGTPLRGSNVFIRRFNDWRDKRNMIAHLDRNLNPNDCILFYGGQDVEFTMRVIKVAHKHGAFYTRDLCELPYGTGVETLSAIRKRKYTLERQFPQLDGVIAISDTLATLARSYTRKDCKIVKVPIMVDFEQYRLEDTSQQEKVPYIFHSGTLYEQKDGFVGMLEAFGKAKQKLNSPLKFISTGHVKGSRHEHEIIRVINQYHIENDVMFTGYLSNDELKAKLQGAALVIINKYKTQQNHYCFSTKLGEYLAAAKPVIITRVGEAMNWLTDGKDCIIVEPEDNDALADAIVEAVSQLASMRNIGKNGQNMCRHAFDYRNYGKVLVDFFTSLSNKTK